MDSVRDGDGDGHRRYALSGGSPSSRHGYAQLSGYYSGDGRGHLFGNVFFLRSDHLSALVTGCGKQKSQVKSKAASSISVAV
jgi:hypothetical protein